MPSNNMQRYWVDLYADQADQIDRVVNDHKVKRTRFLRECVIHILQSETRTKSVIKQCQTPNYIKTQ